MNDIQLYVLLSVIPPNEMNQKNMYSIGILIILDRHSLLSTEFANFFFSKTIIAERVAILFVDLKKSEIRKKSCSKSRVNWKRNRYFHFESQHKERSYNLHWNVVIQKQNTRIQKKLHMWFYTFSCKVRSKKHQS